jgi:arginase
MQKTIRIIGVNMDLGQSRRGVDVGPSAIRYADLAARLSRLGYQLSDEGNIQVPVKDSITGSDVAQAIHQAIHQACTAVYDVGRQAVKDKCIPIFLGGDHSISIGTIGGITHDSPCGVIWIDAHGDYNTSATSTTGNTHGMPLAALTGTGDHALVDIGRPGAAIKPEDVVLIGLRDLDPVEQKLLRKSGITIFTMRDIDESGISEIAHKALASLMHHQRLHVSLDMDSLDPMIAPGVGTPVPGGLTYREAQLLMETFADSHRISSMDIVEINPIIDTGNQTAKIAVDLAASLFGKRII